MVGPWATGDTQDNFESHVLEMKELLSP
jgi:hypothetical protein